MGAPVRTPRQKVHPVIDAKATPAAPRVSPAWLARLRGLLAVPVAVALVLGAPGLAYATFTARTTAAVSVGTYKVPAPASISGTLECRTGNGAKGAIITFTDFAEVDRATGYTATLTPPSGSPSVVPLSGEGTMQVTMFVGTAKGKYTFRLTARVGSWTGLPLEQTVNC
ncbi:hypothetical protein [Pseudarthrobacter sp. MM222]|uniref:hypothetical protein n=1 Tax=Pseudarthrobacter sp. MM222 TaxID=3018929 RepID=UPI002220CBAC|nr:hypothetical protein [Pseudarthrobacter sp. MM222]